MTDSDHRAASHEQIAAGIVTFNPDMPRLHEALESIIKQVDAVYIVDNASRNTTELDLSVRGHTSIHLLRNARNEGIAKALNQLADAARVDGFSQMLFLDQDSVPDEHLIRVLSSQMTSGVALASPQIVDRNRQRETEPHLALDHKTYLVKSAARKGIITSGSLIKLKALEDVGGFDEMLFIDYVDYDLNKRLLLEGYKLIRTGDAYLSHECGSAAPTILWTPRRGQDEKWRFERFYSFGHDPFRCYYKARNRIIYSKKYKGLSRPWSFEGAAQIAPQIILTTLFEKRRFRKLAAFIRGITDGLQSRVERYQPRSF